jgi:polysaccharide biosynthesis protein PslF
MGRVRRSIARLAPDVVNVQVEPAAYGMKAGIYFLPRVLGPDAPPVVVTFHDLLPPYLFPKAGRLRLWSVLQLARDAAGIIVTNREDETALRAGLGKGSERAAAPLRLIPIGSNIVAQPVPGFDRARWRERYGLGRDDLVVSFFGFMNRTKGIETLLEATARINGTAQAEPAAEQKPVHLLFIGGRTGTSDVTNARYADDIDALMATLTLDAYVHRTGYADASEVSAAFYAADICALPYTEGANLRHGTLHAALAHGCATITTSPTLPTPELRDGENVMLIPPGNEVALAEAVRRLARDPALRRRLGEAASALARRYTWPQIAEEVMALMETLPRHGRIGTDDHPR